MRGSKHRKGSIGAFVFLFALVAQTGFAAESDWADKRFNVWARAFFASTNTSIRVDSDTLEILGTLIDVEDDLGIDNSVAMPLVGAQWRFRQRHMLELAYFELNRSATIVVEDEIQWGDLVVPVDFELNSSVDTNVARLAYRYALVQDTNQEFSIGGGLHWTEMKAGISVAGIGTGSVASDGPLPMITLAYEYRLSPKWTAVFVGEWFGIELDQAEGELVHGDATLLWQTWENVALGVGYNFFEIDFKDGEADFKGLFDYNYQGPFLGVEFVF